MALVLEKRNQLCTRIPYCTPSMSYPRFPHNLELTATPADIYDSFLRVLLTELEEPDSVELKASLGRRIVSSLPKRFIEDNKGRFIAITFTRKILAVTDTLRELHEKIIESELKENYYIERIGHKSIAQI